LHLQTVQIKKSNKETLIISGINEGEKVVTEPLINAYDEMIVKVLKEGQTNKEDIKTEKIISAK